MHRIPGEGTIVHHELRELLRDAVGESHFVLAANVDIRGFSSFFSDSSQAAAFLSTAYTHILDEYFPDASFFKPTGDGLLLVRVVTKEDLQSSVRAYVDAAIRLDGEFANICSTDDLINFETPSRIGVGLARGTATRLSSGGKVLDFSGYPLNLASRLMDLARPGGVVFDESLGVHLLEDETAALFSTDSVYVKGLSDLNPMTVHATADVRIPDANRRPIGAEFFAEHKVTSKFSEFQQRGRLFMHRLTHQPASTDSVRLHVAFPRVDANGQKLNNVMVTRALEATEVEQHPEGLLATFDLREITEAMKEYGVKRTWLIEENLSYSVPIGTVGRAADHDGPADGSADGSATPDGSPDA